MSDNTNNWSEREVGALWKQQSNKGTKYLSGHIKMANGETEQVRVVVFANKDKKNTKAPDFRMYRSEERENTSETAASATSDTSTEVDDVLE